jgi:transposase-like protein
MIINYDFYYCSKCKESHGFDTSKEYSKLCPDCNEEMEFWTNADGDTDLAEQRKNQMPIVPSSKPTITCPYCQSTNTKKIGIVSRSTSFGLLGFGSGKVGKQWHCNSCKSDF